MWYIFPLQNGKPDIFVCFYFDWKTVLKTMSLDDGLGRTIKCLLNVYRFLPVLVLVLVLLFIPQTPALYFFSFLRIFAVRQGAHRFYFIGTWTMSPPLSQFMSKPICTESSSHSVNPKIVFTLLSLLLFCANFCSQASTLTELGPEHSSSHPHFHLLLNWLLISPTSHRV